MDYISEILSTLALVNEMNDLVPHLQSNQKQSHRLIKATSRFIDPLNFMLSNQNRISGEEDDIIELNCLVEESLTHLKQFVDDNWELRGNKFQQDVKKFNELIENFSRIFATLLQHLEISSTEPFGSIEDFTRDHRDDRVDLSQKLRNSLLNEQEFTKIDQNDVELSFFLGDGASARVYKGIWCGTEVAVKTVIKKVDYEKAVLEARQQEYLKFPNIVSTYGVCETSDQIWFIGELAPLKDLKHLLYDQPDIDLPVYLKIGMLLDIASGMKYLHSRKPEILHRDLKSGNVLVFPGLKIKIADFGTARAMTIDSVTQSANKVGSELWMAPEIILGKTNVGLDDSDGNESGSGDEKEKRERFFLYSKQSDVWSFAIMIYELICRKIPFNGSNVQAVLYLSQNKRPKIDSSIQKNSEYESLINLMSKCWRQDRHERPLFPEIVIKLQENLKQYDRNELLQASSRAEEILRARVTEANSKLMSITQTELNSEEKLSEEDLKRIDEANLKFEAKMTRFNLVNEIASEHISTICSLVTSPNGQYIVSASDDCTIKIWKDINYKKSNCDVEETKNESNVPLFTCDKTLIGHSDFVRSVKCGFLDNQKQSDLFVVSGSYDKTVKMWNGETGECRWTGKGHPNIIYGVAISSGCNNNRRLVASVGNDKTIKIWDVEESNQEIAPVQIISNTYNTDWIYSVSFCSGNTNRSERVITIGCDDIMNKSHGVVKVFDLETGNRAIAMRTRHQNIGYPSHVFVSPCNKYAISNASGDDRIIIHDLRTGQLVHQITKNTPLSDIKLIGNNYLLLAPDGSTAQILNYKTNQCVQTFTNSTNTFSSVVNDPCNNYIVYAEEDTHQLKIFGEI